MADALLAIAANGAGGGPGVKVRRPTGHRESGHLGAGARMFHRSLFELKGIEAAVAHSNEGAEITSSSSCLSPATVVVPPFGGLTSQPAYRRWSLITSQTPRRSPTSRSAIRRSMPMRTGPWPP